jgi:methionyl-tRNA formyltransferase
VVERRVLVACGGDTSLELVEVQLEGRKRVAVEAFINGQRIEDNEVLGDMT